MLKLNDCILSAITAIFVLAFAFLGKYADAGMVMVMVPETNERPAPVQQFEKILRSPEVHTFVNAPVSAPNCHVGKTKKGSIRALLIGINEYSSPDVPDLNGAVNDTKLLAQALRAKSVAKENIRIHTNYQATRENILHSLDKLMLESGCGDFVMVHFSGSSRFHPDVGTILFPSDVTYVRNQQNHQGLPQMGIVAQDLAAAMVHIRNKGANIFVTIDSSYAGGLTLAIVKVYQTMLVSGVGNQAKKQTEQQDHFRLFGSEQASLLLFTQAQKMNLQWSGISKARVSAYLLSH